MTISSLLAAVLALSTILPAAFREPLRATKPDAVAATIGAGGFNLLRPIHAGTLADQQRQIAGRLAYLEDLLRSRNVSDLPTELQAARMRNLDLIHEYRLAGAFPRNFDHPDQSRPCFIDRDGTICAVGYLVEKSAGRGVAEEINRSFQYATIAEMRTPVLDRWIAGSGLTRAEVMTIQEPAMNENGELIGGMRPVRMRRIDTVEIQPVVVTTDSSRTTATPATGETAIH